MAFHWGADLPGDGKLLSSIPRPYSHIAEWWRARRWRR